MLKTQIKIIFLLCFIMCILFLNSTLASCPVAIYKIQGQIVNNEKGSIEHALVVIFFDEESIGCSGVTSATGQYEIRCRYDTYKGRSWFSKDIMCGRKPSSLTLVVYAENYHPKRITLKAEELFKLPPIVLHRKASQ